MMQKQKKQGPVRGCVVPFFTVIGLLALCYVFCLVIFLLNGGAGGSNTAGLLPFLPW